MTKMLIYFAIFFSLFCMAGCGQSGDDPNLNSELDASIENIIELSVVEDLRLSDTSNLTIDDCVAFVSDYSNSELFMEGDLIPSNTLIFIDFDEVYTSWEDYEVEIVCDNANYGLYQTKKSLTAPNIGQFWYIVNKD
jgi:hypothetical protein